MIDKEWLERVDVAYTEYKRLVGPSLPIENFISWMYRQYGIIEPKDKK